MVQSVGTSYSNNFHFPSTQSFDAINLLKSVAPGHSGDTEQVVFGTSGDASLTDPAIGQRINKMVRRDQRAAQRDARHQPVRRGGQSRRHTNINADQTVGFFQVPFDKQANNISDSRGQDVRRHRHRGPPATA